MSQPDLTTRIDALLTECEGLSVEAWRYVETQSDCGQEFLGCGVLDDNEREFLWLEGNPEDDVPTARAIAALPDLVKALREARTALAAEYKRGRIEEREACAKAAENYRAHLNFHALLQVLREEPLPSEIVDSVSNMLDALAAAIRARGETND